MAMLARREHSRHELQHKLQRKGCAPPLIEQVLQELERERLLSDERFVEALLQVRRERGFGPLYIQQELQQKGVAEALIAQYIDVADAQWLTILQRVKHKRFGAQPPATLQARAKQTRFLQYRGFTFDQIRRVIDGLEDD